MNNYYYRKITLFLDFHYFRGTRGIVVQVISILLASENGCC